MTKDLEDKIPEWDNKKLLGSLLTQPLANLIKPVAYRGDNIKNFNHTLRDIHLLMRSNYSELIHKVGRNVYPVIIANDNESIYQGVGGSYTLYLENGTRKRTVPTSPDYEIHKNLSHIPLGLFTIISPYFYSKHNLEWKNKIKEFQEKVREARNIVNDIGSKKLIFTHSESMLAMADEYINECLHKNQVNIDSYMDFTKKYLKYIKLSIELAAELQVNNVRPKLLEWKKSLGEKWQDLHVIIPTVWPVSENNPRKQIFESLMDSEKAKTNIIMTENTKTLEEALTVLGRVVTDRAAARLIFGTESKTSCSLTCALSTSRDLISDACENSIKNLNIHS